MCDFTAASISALLEISYIFGQTKKSKMNTFYKNSGQFSPISFLYFLLVALLIFPIVGVIYAYAIWYIPFIYINFLIAGALGFVMGRLISFFVLKKGKVRNVPLAIVYGIVGGLIGMYFHWAAWIDLVANISDTMGNDRIGVAISNIEIFQFLYFVNNPSILFEAIDQVNEFGTWGIKSAPVSGTFLSVIWIIELIIVVGATVLFSHGQAKNPFSEKLNEWNKEMSPRLFGKIEDLETILNGVQNDDPAFFESLSPYKEGESYGSFTLFHIDGDDSYLDISNQIASKNKKGELEYDEQHLTVGIAVKPQVQDHLLSLMK